MKRKGRGDLRDYAPGINADPFPENTGLLLPAGTTLEFQMHYTPVGRPAVDATRMGIWVLDETPKHEVFSQLPITISIGKRLIRFQSQS